MKLYIMQQVYIVLIVLAMFFLNGKNAAAQLPDLQPDLPAQFVGAKKKSSSGNGSGRLLSYFETVKDTPKLEVVVAGIEEDKGAILIAIYNSKDNFMDLPKATQVARVVIANKKATHLFENLPAGEYAISLFHDINGNGKHDKNFLGIPVEPYGFSNNARGAFGPPSFEASKFHYTGGSMSVTLKIK